MINSTSLERPSLREASNVLGTTWRIDTSVFYTIGPSHPPLWLSAIPQGSLLGPALFLAMIHDLQAAMGIDPLQILSAGTVGHTDAVVIWISGPSDESVRPVIESTARSIVAYMEYNSMALNPERTQVL